MVTMIITAYGDGDLKREADAAGARQVVLTPVEFPRLLGLFEKALTGSRGVVIEMPRYTLETIVIVLLILWLLGWQAFPVGNPIHLLLLVILAVVVFRVVRGRSPV
jgi:hypothetical protein